ncbi:CvpA family protein [Sulfurimonas sp.]
MEFNYFDLIVGSIILLLGLKGILNGFFKEAFGLVGIVGGIFVASRAGDSVGGYLSDTIFNFTNQSAISFTGFIVTLAIFWLLMIAIGFGFKKLSSLSGLGHLDKVLGFVFGASKFFFITAVIASAAYNIKALKPTLDSSMENSVLFPILVETGKFIMKVDPTEVTKDINATIDKTTEAVKDKTAQVVSENVKESIKDKVDEIKKELQEK